jgi:hypothetical protein
MRLRSFYILKRTKLMEIVLTRNPTGPASTIGKLVIVGSTFNCLTLEDVDRGLTKEMSVAQIAAIKIQDRTAIPKGRYQVIIDFSEHFQKAMPLLLNVPGYGGIRIHSGNTDLDTDGCILLGLSRVNADFIGSSREAYAAFYQLLSHAINNGEAVFITIQ